MGKRKKEETEEPSVDASVTEGAEAGATPQQLSASIRTIQKWATLDRERYELEQRLTAIEAQQKEMQEAVLGYFERQGIDRVTIEGVTYFPRCDVYASKERDVEPEVAVEAVRAAGLDEFVGESVSWPRVSAFVRELRRDEKPLPPEFEGAIRVSEVWRVASRKTG